MFPTVLLLLASNVFMTFAWYGHLKHQRLGMLAAILISWGIAFFEYCLQVPANRLGAAAGMATAELKTVQEVLTLLVFMVFSVTYLGEPLRWNVVAGFALVLAGAALVFKPW